MHAVTTLARFRTVAAIAVAMLAMFAFAPTAHMSDPLGIEDAGAGSVLGDQPLVETVVNIINVALTLLGIVSVVIILIAGFKWMTAGGNEDQVAEAKKRITQGVIGLAVILSAYAIANFVISNLVTETGAG
jgi:hypothetical protein